VEIVNVPGFTCCPDPIYFKATDKTSWLTMAARNLCEAEEKGLDIFTICSGCTATLLETSHLLNEHPELREEVNRKLARVGKHYNGTVRVRHIVTFIRDEVGIEAVAKSVRRPLEGLRIAIHYGCHLLKPSRIMNVDDPDHPHMLDDLIHAIGATPVRHKEWILCCGRAVKEPEIRQDMMATLLSSVKEQEADCLCVICPSCFGEFDLGQVTVSKRIERDVKTPAVYYFQLLAIAQGQSATGAGLDKHRAKADRILELYSEAL
jgi:heterodisulfide reductase subunit B